MKVDMPENLIAVHIYIRVVPTFPLLPTTHTSDQTRYYRMHFEYASLFTVGGVNTAPSGNVGSTLQYMWTWINISAVSTFSERILLCLYREGAFDGGTKPGFHFMYHDPTSAVHHERLS